MRIFGKSLIVLLVLLLCGCQSDKTDSTNSSTQSEPLPFQYITVDGVSISVDQINVQIKNTFNTQLFYGGFFGSGSPMELNEEFILSHALEYDLYFEPNGRTGADAFVLAPKIYIIITNIAHPLSTADNPLLYNFGIDVTKFGLRSNFSYMAHISKHLGDGPKTLWSQYLGHYSLRITEVSRPLHENPSDEWVTTVKNGLRLFMDNCSSYAIDRFAPGKYTVYVQGFSQSDVNSAVVFVHENGAVYMGDFYFVHEVSNGVPANLNRVALIDYANDKQFQVYLSRLRKEAVLEMEHVVE